jgi:hypothetical protein
MRRRLTILRTVAAIVVTLCASDVTGAEIRIHRDRSNDLNGVRIVIEGPIERGDQMKFLAAVREASGFVDDVLLYTRGGDFHEAIQIGRTLRALGLSARAPLASECEGRGLTFLLQNGYLTSRENCVCASAGFFILAGAVSRSGDNVYIHRPVLPQEVLLGLSGAEAAAVAGVLRNEVDGYLQEMGVPRSVVDRVWSIPGSEAVRLSEADRKEHFFLWVPALQDWYDARCPGDRSTVGCFQEAKRELQAEGFLKVFGEDPNIYDRIINHQRFVAEAHPFGLWVEAQSFLGATPAEVSRAIGGRYFGYMDLGGRRVPLFSEHDYLGDRVMHQRQSGPDPSVALLVSGTVVKSVVVSFRQENFLFSDEVFGRIDREIQAAFGRAQAEGTEAGERTLSWSLAGGGTVKLSLGEGSRTLSYDSIEKD